MDEETNILNEMLARLQDLQLDLNHLLHQCRSPEARTLWLKNQLGVNYTYALHSPENACELFSISGVSPFALAEVLRVEHGKPECAIPHLRSALFVQTDEDVPFFICELNYYGENGLQLNNILATLAVYLISPDHLVTNRRLAYETVRRLLGDVTTVPDQVEDWEHEEDWQTMMKLAANEPSSH